MSSNKRRISRRAVGVVVAASLMVLGLEGTAMAAPTVTSFTPTTGPVGCVIVLTGTGFLDVPQAQQDVVFVGPVAGPADDIVLDGGTAADAAFFTRISATEMWVEVPAATSTPPANTGLALGVGYTIQVTDPTGGTASSTTFTRVTGAGGCGPTVASLTPTCGNTGDTVVIAGTNLIGPGLVGATTAFSPYTTNAAHTVPDVDVPTSISVVVPSGSTDGLVRVTTFAGGVAFSPTVFDISDACLAPPGDTHARSITFRLSQRGRARGVVSVADDTAECIAGVPVKIQRRRAGAGWRTKARVTTNDSGAYTGRVRPRPGRYRAVATRVVLEDASVCLRAPSAKVRIRRRG